MTTNTFLETFIQTPATVAVADDALLLDAAQGQEFRGRGAVVGMLHILFVAGFSGVHIDVENALSDSTVAAIEFLFRGRQTGAFLGMPATGRTVNVPMVIVCRCAGGALQRAALYYDAGTLLRQLGFAR